MLKKGILEINSSELKRSNFNYNKYNYLKLINFSSIPSLEKRRVKKKDSYLIIILICGKKLMVSY